MRKHRYPLLLAALFGLFFQDALAQTKMMQQPAVSENHIAFIYAEDLWLADLEGSNPRRLTVSGGVESSPHFSPDGSHIAFSGQYDGNTDVFLIPTEGGIPKRLTWHPLPDWVRGFTPGGEVLFASQRAVFTRRFHQFFTIPAEGGAVEQLVIPSGNRASYSPDGSHIAYTPKREVFEQWKNYRGGTISNIWLFANDDHSIVEIPQPEGGSNDTDPVWMGDKIYFRSDRNGEFNLFSYDVNSRAVQQLTDFDDFPVLRINGGHGRIIFEQAGTLHLFDPASGSSKQLALNLKADLLELRSQYVSGKEHIRSAQLSPSGKRVVFDYRGDVITLPAEKGDLNNLTQTPGVHEKYPAYSPDGKTIAYFSDASGEYELYLHPNGAASETKKYPIDGAGFYAHIHWAPNSEKLCFVDNSRSLFLFTVSDGTLIKIDTDEMYVPGPFRDLFEDWSADGNYVLYTKIQETNYEKAMLYDLKEDRSYAITDGLSNVSSATFDREGKYIYFLASTDAGPVVNWFAQSNNDMVDTDAIYLSTLQKETPNPFFKENEEENGSEEKEEKKEEDTSEKDWEIDLEGLESRIVSLPLAAGMYRHLQVSKSGALLYLSDTYNNVQPSEIRKYDLEKREDSKVMEADDFMLSADGAKMLYRKQDNFGITDAGEAPKNGDGMLNTVGLEVKTDPRSEWENIFSEAWRINRDYFYDPGMHGADWTGMKEKYRPFLAYASCKSDVYRIIGWMCSELAVGHHRYSNPGSETERPDNVPGGLLGADYTIENNRYRFAKIYGGLNWNPELRSPLTEPGVNIDNGEYLLAVNGKELTAEDNLYRHFENTAGKIVQLTVSPNPDGTNSRKVLVTPIDNESALRNRDWVEANLKKVHEATDGQVAYVYVPNTTTTGHQYFKRYFFPQANKKAIIVDERFNAGGQIADYYIDLLMRPYQAYWNFRYGQDLKTPSASIQGPKVMLIDENAGSGGDMLPWMFRKFGLGTLIGQRTWGGLVGILGFPEFIDGGTVTAPNLAIWTKDGFIVENVGVAPDIEVVQIPAEVIQGGDPQLERAIEEVMKQLKENPPIRPKRPDYPIRVRK